MASNHSCQQKLRNPAKVAFSLLSLFLYVK